MTTLRQVAQLARETPPVSVRQLARPVVPGTDAISVRAVISRLLGSTVPIVLEVELLDSAEGPVPFQWHALLHSSAGVVLETTAVLRGAGGTLINRWELPQSIVSQTIGYNLTQPGRYSLDVVRRGLVSGAHVEVVRSAAISASPPVRPAEPTRPAPLRPSIAVQPKGDGGFKVTGSGFTPGARVHLRIVDAAQSTLWQEQSADAQGNLEHDTGAICRGAGPVHFSANDGRDDPSDFTGVFWSNTVTSLCS